MSAIIIGNRYELIEKIGSGGMAVVYKARCRLLNRYVAIKMLRPEYNDDVEFLKRFETEAQAAASLSHTNIVSVYDVGTHDKIHYIVMEYAEGVTLKKYMSESGILPLDVVIDFSMQIASALEHAHLKGIVHHDIKPHNIMVGSGGILKVTDFGLARAVSGSTNVVGNSALGSVHYASPEQSRGGFTDEKSDIYSLGVTMYEMATGKVPFDGETPVAVAMKHMQKPPVPPSNINSAITGDIEKIILRAMEKEPRDRYQKVSDLIYDLGRVSGVSEVEAVIKNDSDEKDDKFATRKFTAVKSESDQLEKKKAASRKAEKAVVGSVSEYEHGEPSLVDISEDMQDRKNREEKNGIKKKNDRVAVVAAIFTTIAIVVVLAFIFIKLYASDFSFSEKINVPKLVGLTYEEADEMAEKDGFVLSVETEESEEEEGLVLKQIPEEGEKIKKGGTVSIVISETGRGVVLINYVGKDYEKAIKALETLGIKYVIEEEYNDDVDLGNIIRMDPQPGVTIAKGQTVTLYVSLGKDDSKKTAPDLRGKTLEEAIKVLSDEDLQIGNVTPESSDNATGTIIRQSPIAGSSVISGSSVDVVISEQRVQQGGQTQITGTSSEPTDDDNKSGQNTSGSGQGNAETGSSTQTNTVSDDIRVE